MCYCFGSIRNFLIFFRSRQIISESPKLWSDAKNTPPALRVIDTPEDVGEHVRASRKAQNMRIDDTAGLNNVSVDLLSRLENGSGGVRLDKLITVLDGLGLKLIIGEADEVARLMQFRMERQEQR